MGYDGEKFQAVDKFEIATDTMPVVELFLAGLPALAVSYFGEGEPKLVLPIGSRINEDALKSGLQEETPPGAPSSASAAAPASAPPSLVVVQPQKDPFTDGTPRVP